MSYHDRLRPVNRIIAGQMKKSSRPRGRPANGQEFEEAHIYVRTETMREIRETASREDRSIAAQIRVFIERGMDASRALEPR